MSSSCNSCNKLPSWDIQYFSISSGFVSVYATVLSDPLNYRDMEYWIMNRIQNSQNVKFVCLNDFFHGNSLGIPNS